MSAQSVKWLAFCASNSITRTVVHFFPSTGVVTAAYAANCTLTLFGEGVEKKTVTLEGARAGHPDGVRLEQVFAELVDGAPGFLGLEVELFASQPRIDISASSCIIELFSRVSSVRFVPRRLPDSGLKQRDHLPGLLLEDGLNTTSVILINGAGSEYEFSISRPGRPESPPENGAGLRDTSAQMRVWRRESLAGRTLLELGLVQSDSRREALYLNEALPEQACYVLYRDKSQKRLISVCAL
ncbi:MAG: hypothetical protein GX589_10500 [Deltaproteobacteria bacterium]|nr:hypothetical protein [Deltaproteobacteria bacterium]